MKQQLISIFILFLTIISFCVHAETESDSKKISYHQLTPDLITNLELDKEQTIIPTIMIRIVLMTNSIKDQELLKKHEPRYKDPIILLINKYKKNDLQTVAQKKKLKIAIKDIINISLQNETKKPEIVKRVLFTRMVVE